MSRSRYDSEMWRHQLSAIGPNMLNPPLSLLSDLLVSIVEQLAMLRFADTSGNLRNLSLGDRAFTHSCQYIFRKLKFGTSGYGSKISEQLTNGKKFFYDKPSFANRVRVIELEMLGEESVSLLKDPDFTSIFELFAKSPIPPYEFHLSGSVAEPILDGDHMFLMRQLTESFFSQTLTILWVKCIPNVPLPLFLIYPRLREVILELVGATDNSYDKYPISQWSGREAPLLEVLELRYTSCTLVEQIIAPPPMFNTPVVILSNLRVLTLAPYGKEEMVSWQPILNAACNTLEELYLIFSSKWGVFYHRYEIDKFLKTGRQLSFAGLVNLSNLSNLKTFSFFGIVKCAPEIAPPLTVLHDINAVLRTIPKSNRVTKLWLLFEISGVHPFLECLDQDWVGIFNEVIRIGDGKPLDLEFAISVSKKKAETEEDELYTRIMEKAATLSFHSNIYTHWWDSTFRKNMIWYYDIPLGQVCTRCR